MKESAAGRPQPNLRLVCPTLLGASLTASVVARRRSFHSASCGRLGVGASLGFVSSWAFNWSLWFVTVTQDLRFCTNAFHLDSFTCAFAVTIGKRFRARAAIGMLIPNPRVSQQRKQSQQNKNWCFFFLKKKKNLIKEMLINFRQRGSKGGRWRERQT